MDEKPTTDAQQEPLETIEITSDAVASSGGADAEPSAATEPAENTGSDGMAPAEPEPQSAPAVAEETAPAETPAAAQEGVADQAAGPSEDAPPATEAAEAAAAEAAEPASAADAATAEKEPEGPASPTAGDAAEAPPEAPEERRERHLADVCRRAEELAEVENYKGFERKWRKIQERWQELTAEEPAPEAVAARFATAAAAVEHRREQEADRQAQRRTDNLARLKGLTERIEALATVEELSLRKAHRTNREAQLALRSPGPLPGGEEAASQWAELKQRLQAAYDQLAPRVAQLEQEEEWKRWANVPLQEELCERMEALATHEDLGHVASEMRRLSEEWKTVASAPPEKSEELWQRFRAAREKARERTKDFFEEQKKERQENLEKKRVLVERVEALADSTDWKQTAEEIKTLQAEWKAIGPVPRKHSDSIWKQFRGLCDQFFDRRKTFYDSLHQERMNNLEHKRTLVEKVEALAESTDWDQTTEKIKALQAEWKAVGPVPRKHSELIWKRFRKACDTFFDRRSRRHEVGLEDNLKKRQELIAELEALLPGTSEKKTDKKKAGKKADQREAGTDAAPQETVPQEAAVPAEAGAGETPTAVAEAGEVAEASAVYDTTEAAEPVAAAAETETEAPGAEATAASHEAPEGEEPAEPAVPADLAATIQRVREAWRQAGDVPNRDIPALERRWSEVSDRLVESYGEHLAGTDLDPSANHRKREQLVQRYEELVIDWRKQLAEKPQEPSLDDLAAKLKAALAANTIRGAGGRAADDAWQQTRQKAGRIEESWSRIPGKPEPATAERFDKARKELAHLNPPQAG